MKEPTSTGGGKKTRARRFNISPIPSFNTRRRSLSQQALEVVPYMLYTPDRPTRPNMDAAPRRGNFFRNAVFEEAVDEVVDANTEAYTERDREELKQSFLRVADELEKEGRFEMKFGRNKENYESNLKKVVKKVDLVALGRKAVEGAAMDKVLRKTMGISGV
jgi:U3 small nucleolar RNA-associated protein 14